MGYKDNSYKTRLEFIKTLNELDHELIVPLEKGYWLETIKGDKRKDDFKILLCNKCPKCGEIKKDLLSYKFHIPIVRYLGIQEEINYSQKKGYDGWKRPMHYFIDALTKPQISLNILKAKYYSKSKLFNKRLKN